MEKILSVSIAAYNVEATLEAALRPFIKSRYRDWLDVMVIDDGSNDRTAEIAGRYVKKYPGVFRLIQKENGGWGSTLNTGMKKACGKYFKQLDGDDYFSEENLDLYLEFLQDCDADLVYTTFLTFDDKTGAVIRELGRYEKNVLPERCKLSLDELTGFVPAMHTLTVRTGLLQKHAVHITEHCFYTDVEFVLKCCNFCKTLIFFELPVYYYRLARSGQSMSAQGVRRHYQDHLRMLYAMLEYEKKYVRNQAVKRMFQQRLADVCMMQYQFFFALAHNGRVKKECMRYDASLREKYPYYYEKTNGRMLQFMRKNHFLGYTVYAAAADSYYKKRKLGVYEGC